MVLLVSHLLSYESEFVKLHIAREVYNIISAFLFLITQAHYVQAD